MFRRSGASHYEEHYKHGGFGYDAKVDEWRKWVKLHYVVEFGLKRKMRLFDVGCGDGFWAMLLTENGLSVAGVDRSGSAITAARQRLPEARFEQADLTEPLPFKPASFDVAFLRGFSIFGSPTLGDEGSVLQLTNIIRVLKPAGMLLVSNFSSLTPPPRTGDEWVHNPASTVIRAIESVANPYKMVRVGGFVQIASRPKPATAASR